MNRLTVVALALTASACTHTIRKTSETGIVEQPHVYSCKSNVDGRLAVHPLGDKTGSDIKLDGMDDILISELTRSGCFQEVERDKAKMSVLFEEVDRCGPDAKDKERYDCSTFAQKGKLMGVTHYVFTDVVMFSPKVAASELQAKVPGIGDLSTNEQYAAVVLNVRAVDVASGEVAASAVVHAVVPSQKAGIDLGMKGASLKVAAESHTPMGEAIMKMLATSIEDLHASWRKTTGNGAGSAAAAAGAGSGSGSAAAAVGAGAGSAAK